MYRTQLKVAAMLAAVVLLRNAWIVHAQNVTLFEDIDFVGDSFGATGDVSFVGWEWNDRISSVSIPFGFTVTIYEHSEFGGQSLTLTGDNTDLRWFPGPGADGTWNDAASSIRVTGGEGPPPPSRLDLAIRWSPVIYHGTHNNYDIPTRWDFDNNMSGQDNWEHAFYHINNFQAYVYYTYQESDSHYFLTYLFFHPRDTKTIGPHENDWEGARVTVEKDGTSWGGFRKLETMSLSGLHTTTNPQWENGRPIVWVEARGHGSEVFNDGIFPNDCGGLVLSHAGRGAEVPSHCNDRDVSYELISFEDTLWPLRTQNAYGGPFAETFMFNGAYFGGRFYDDDGCHSNPPWSWTGDGGSWFLNPQPAAHYIYNPFGSDLSSGIVRECGG